MKGARVLGLLLLAVLCACTHESNQDIAVVQIHGRACPNCAEHLTIWRSGAISELTWHGLSGQNARVAGDAIDSLPLDELRQANPPPPFVGPATFASIVVSYRDGRYQQVPVPVDPGMFAGTRRLSQWMNTFAFEATEVLMKDRWRVLADAFRRGSFRAISLEARGCYGWCPIYLATFNSNGTATLHARGPRCDMRAKAIVRFRRVLDAVRSGHAATLRPAYPIQAVDTFGARITLTTAHQVFISDGPDSTSWGPEFLATESRLDQIVRDTKWSPPLDIPRCSGAPQKLRG